MSEYAREKKFYIENIIPYENEVYRFLVRITDDRILAEDLLQNAMEKAWRKIGQLREPEKARSWFFSIARNEVFTYYRTHENLELYDEEYDLGTTGSADIDSEQADVLENLVNDFDLRAMREAFRRLEGKYRKLIVLHFYQGMNQREIADLLNQKHSTIRVNLVRALRRVREIRSEIEKGEF